MCDVIFFSMCNCDDGLRISLHLFTSFPYTIAKMQAAAVAAAAAAAAAAKQFVPRSQRADSALLSTPSR
jgi:hypothetical protein